MASVSLEYKFSGDALTYDSIVHLCNEWYAGYWRDVEFTIPHGTIGELVLSDVRNNEDRMRGMYPSEDDFGYIVHSAEMGHAHDMIDVGAKYGKSIAPKAGFGDLDNEAALEILSHELMERMGYK